MSHPIRNVVIGANRPHTREDLLKQENRVNMMLYGAHSIREFWEPLSFRLGVPQGSWLTREVIEAKEGRPDFILNGSGLTTGCIEVELGLPESTQLRRYHDEGYDPVICIVGRQGGLHGHVSLEEVATLARSVATRLHTINRPAAEVLTLLAETIRDALDGFRARAVEQPIPAHLLGLPWFVAVIEPLSALRTARYVVNRTISSRSLSLQLERVPCMSGKRLALLTQKNPALFLVPVPEEMARVLGGPMDDVTTAWSDVLSNTLPNWPLFKDGNKRIRIEAKILERNYRAFTAVFAHLAQRVLGAPS